MKKLIDFFTLIFNTVVDLFKSSDKHDEEITLNRWKKYQDELYKLFYSIHSEKLYAHIYQKHEGDASDLIWTNCVIYSEYYEDIMIYFNKLSKKQSPNAVFIVNDVIGVRGHYSEIQVTAKSSSTYPEVLLRFRIVSKRVFYEEMESEILYDDRLPHIDNSLYNSLIDD